MPLELFSEKVKKGVLIAKLDFIVAKNILNMIFTLFIFLNVIGFSFLKEKIL